MAILGTVRGLGSFASESLNQSLTLLQSFIAVTVFTALILGAILAERAMAEEKLKVAITDLATINQELEYRVADRTQELNHKNQSLNDTLEELHQIQTQLIQSEKMSGLEQMVAGIAHEINNPVNFIHGNLKHLNDHLSEMVDIVKSYQQHSLEPNPALEAALEDTDFEFAQQDTRKILSSMKTGTARISEIVRSLRNFSRLDESDMKLADINEGLESTLLILQHRLSQPDKGNRIQIIRDYNHDIPLVECFPGLLNQAVMNILNNSIDAVEEQFAQSPEGEPPTITLRTDVVENWAQISISDNGNGIPTTVQGKVFDPFFTTKPVGQGTGMGLPISYQIITKKHSGKLTFDSAVGQGTEFLLKIPLKQAS